MNILESDLFDGIMVGLYIQLILVGLIYVFSSLGKARPILIGAFSLAIGLTKLYAVLWDFFKDSLLANMLLGGFKTLFFAPLLYMYIVIVSIEHNKRRFILSHLSIPLFLSIIYTVIKFGTPSIFANNYVVIAQAFLLLNISLFAFYLLLMKRNLNKLNVILPSLKSKYQVFFFSIISYFLITYIIDFISVFIIEQTNQVYFTIYQHIIFMLGFLIYFFIIIFAVSESNRLKSFFINKSPYLDTELAEKKQEIKNLVLKNIVEQKLYKKPGLTSKFSAERLGVRKKILVEYIRFNHNQSFNEFINDLRIEEFKKIYDENDLPNFSISGVAYEVGFKSKATFYRIFKERTGMTPGDYINR